VHTQPSGERGPRPRKGCSEGNRTLAVYAVRVVAHGQIDRNRGLWLITSFAPANTAAAGRPIMVDAARKELERGKHETDVSTSQPETETYARLSCSDGDARRARRVETTTRQGPQAPNGDDSPETAQSAPRIKPEGFPKLLRLRRREDFVRVQTEGRRRVQGPFVVLRVDRPEGPSRLGVTASRKVGRAVLRNRAKRLVREFFRRHVAEIHPPADIVVIVRPRAAKLTYQEVERDLAGALGLRR
jgi:ribonuclease P protein component